jgi:tRNA (mo5U34)-methyltransferase
VNPAVAILRRVLDALRKRRAAGRVGFWWHSIDLGDGVVTPGYKSPEALAAEWETAGLGDLTSRTVLDIGGWDGYFSFAAERAGAERVALLDHYVWSLDLAGWEKHQGERAAKGLPPQPAHEVPGLWRPDELPGKRGFDVAHDALGSEVEAVVGDFMEMDLTELGEFDFVLYLGVLYHMENPLEALRRVRSVTRELAVIESEAMSLEGEGNRALAEFFPGTELAGDPSNWWSPNREALTGLCRAAEFAESSIVTTSGELPPEPGGLSRFRAVAHARTVGS